MQLRKRERDVMGRSRGGFPAGGTKTPLPGLGTQWRYRAGRGNTCHPALAHVASCAALRFGSTGPRCCGTRQTQHHETFLPKWSSDMPVLLLLLLLPPAPRGSKLFMCKANILGRTRAPSPAQFRGSPPPSPARHGVTFSRLSVPRWVAEPGWHRRHCARRERDRWERGRLALPVPG